MATWSNEELPKMIDSLQSCAMRNLLKPKKKSLAIKHDCKALEWVPESFLPELACTLTLTWLHHEQQKPHGTFPKNWILEFVHKTWTVLYFDTNKLNWQQDDGQHPLKFQWMPTARLFCPLQRRRQAQVSLLVATPLELPHLTIITLRNQYLYTLSKYSSMFHWIWWCQSCQVWLVHVPFQCHLSNTRIGIHS